MTTTVLFSSLPKGILLALDLISLTTSPAFHGIKNVPPGPHFVFTGTDAGLAIRHGIWFVVSEVDRGRELVFQWYAEEERLVQVFEEGQGVEGDDAAAVVPRSAEGSRGLRDQLGGGLVDYRLQQRGSDRAAGPVDDDEIDTGDGDTSTPTWQSLTSYIDADILSQILSPARSSSENLPVHPRWTITSSSTTPQDLESENIPGIDPFAFTSSPHPRSQTHLATARPPPSESETLHLLPIDLKQTWPPGAIGRERTEAAQDRSWALLNLISRSTPTASASTSTTDTTTTTSLPPGSTRLLADLQLSFVSTLLLSNPSTLAHWTRLTSLILTCKKAIRQIPGFFAAALDVVAQQVRCLGTSSAIVDAGGIVDEVREEFTVGGGGGFGMGLGGSRAGRMRKLLEAFRLCVVEEEEEEGSSSAVVEPVKRSLRSLYAVLQRDFGWEDPASGTTVLKRGLVTLEDGEQVELAVEGADEEEERGEWAPVVVDLG